MEAKGAMIVMTILPLLGLGMMAVVLFALGAKRDRWIAPGILVVILAGTGWAASMEYGAKVRGLLAKPASPLPAGVQTPESGVAENNVGGNGQERPGEPAPVTSANSSPSGAEATYVPIKPEPQSGGVLRPAPAPVAPTESAHLPDSFPAPPSPSLPTYIPATNPSPPAPSVPTPAPPPPAPPVQPKPVTPPPAPKPVVTPPVVETPRPAPAPVPAPQPKPAVARPTNERGSLTVTVRGPLVVTSQTSASPQLHILIDGGKMSDASPPTRTNESRQDNDPSGPVLAYTFFWDSATFSFSGLEPGFHAVQVSTTGGGNAWNGMIEIRSGEPAQLELGSPAWNSGQLQRLR